MPNLTRAEAVCACTNIIDAIEELDEILPADFSSGIHDRATSMKQYILSETRYPHVTDKMDHAIRGMWNGVQKWNRRGDANDDMFYALADTIDALESGDELPGRADGTSAAAPRTAATTAAKKEAAAQEAAKAQLAFAESAKAMVGDLTPEMQAKLAAMSAASRQGTPAPAPAPQKAAPVTPAAEQPTAPQGRATIDEVQKGVAAVTARVFALLSKARENSVAWVRTRYHEKNVRLVHIEAIKHGDLGPVKKMTTSDRTLQMIEAAYTAGYIAGAKGVTEELQELLKKEK